MVAVYDWEKFDILTGEMIRSQYKMTAEAIADNGGRIVEGTAQDVPEDALDGEQRYNPNA